MCELDFMIIFYQIFSLLLFYYDLKKYIFKFINISINQIEIIECVKSLSLYTI